MCWPHVGANASTTHHLIQPKISFIKPRKNFPAHEYFPWAAQSSLYNSSTCFDMNNKTNSFVCLSQANVVNIFSYVNKLCCFSSLCFAFYSVTLSFYLSDIEISISFTLLSSVLLLLICAAAAFNPPQS